MREVSVILSFVPFQPLKLTKLHSREIISLSVRNGSERVRRIELPYAAWEAAVLPLNYTREEIFDFRFAIPDCNRNNAHRDCCSLVVAPAIRVFGRARHSVRAARWSDIRNRRAGDCPPYLSTSTMQRVL